MKLSLINFIPIQYNMQQTLNEGYGRRAEFDYTGDQVTDPRPNALSLGHWRSPKGNQLFAGLNLNYLSPEQISKLQQHLPTILRDRNLKRRVRKLRSIAPDVFNSAYRTYKKGEMNNVDLGVLKFMKTPEEQPKPGKAPPKELGRTAPAPRPDLTDKVMAQHREPEPEEPEEPEPEEPEEVLKKTTKQPEKTKQTQKLGEPEEDEEEANEVEVDEIDPEEKETL